MWLVRITKRYTRICPGWGHECMNTCPSFRCELNKIKTILGGVACTFELNCVNLFAYIKHKCKHNIYT